jgi:hypothetical protein
MFQLEPSISVGHNPDGKDLLGRSHECTEFYRRVAKRLTARIDQAPLNVGFEFDRQIWLDFELVAIVWIMWPGAYELTFSSQ